MIMTRTQRGHDLMNCGAFFFWQRTRRCRPIVLTRRGWSGHAIAFWRIVDFDVNEAIMTWS